MRGTVSLVPQYAFIAWCSVKKYTDNFTLTVTFKGKVKVVPVL
jgi:hypothetical protein